MLLKERETSYCTPLHTDLWGLTIIFSADRILLKQQRKCVEHPMMLKKMRKSELQLFHEFTPKLVADEFQSSWNLDCILSF